jgi:hypothetical protein
MRSAVAENAVTLVAQAERDLADGDARGALSNIERAYIPVQTNRDLATVERALVVIQQATQSLSAGSRDHRKARRIAEWYVELQRSYAMNPPRPSGEPGVTPGGSTADVPDLGWIDILIGVLGLFTVLALIGGVLIGLAGNATEWRVLGIAGGVFWATMLAAVIAVLRLLQQIERNTRDSAEP